MLELYTKKDCPLCEQTKVLLSGHRVEYVEYVIGQDIMREDVVAKFPEAKVAPIIVVNGYQIAGYTELKTIIDNNQLHLL